MTSVPRLLVLALILAARLMAAVCDDPGVRVLEERHGEVVRLSVETANCLDLTLTLTVDRQNLSPSVALPLTIDTRGRSRVELVTLRPSDPKLPWQYSYRYQWRYGGRGGRPDGTIYELPFAAEVRRTLIQGYRGSFSHGSGSPNEYAHDWAMPEGSLVLAARGGTVVGIRQDSTSGGPGEEFNLCANYVIIRHADGTYGEYLHLQPGGVQVHLGEVVTAGRPLALSGNTGRSTRPHLHFAVFRALDGATRETLPVRFHARDGSVQDLQEGRTY